MSAPVSPGNLFKVLPEFKEEFTLEDVFFRDNRPLLLCDPWDVGLPPDPFKLLWDKNPESAMVDPALFRVEEEVGLWFLVDWGLFVVSLSIPLLGDGCLLLLLLPVEEDD